MVTSPGIDDAKVDFLGSEKPRKENLRQEGSVGRPLLLFH